MSTIIFIPVPRDKQCSFVVLSFRQEEFEMRMQVAMLVTLTLELKAVLRGLSLKLWRLRRKVRSFGAEVAVSSVDE